MRGVYVPSTTRHAANSGEPHGALSLAGRPPRAALPPPDDDDDASADAWLWWRRPRGARHDGYVPHVAGEAPAASPGPTASHADGTPAARRRRCAQCRELLHWHCNNRIGQLSWVEVG